MSLAQFILKEAEKKQRRRKEYTHSTVHSFEFQQLMDVFCDAEVGDEFAWDWRHANTFGNPRLRDAQVNYAYKVANICGVKISVTPLTKYMKIVYLGEVD